MKHPARPLVTAALVLALFAPLALLAAEKAKSDLDPPEKRRPVVELAQHLTRPPEPVAVPANLVHPFNPPDFNQPDPEEQRAAAAAFAKGVGPAPASGAATTAGPGAAGAPSQPAQPQGTREILETLAAKLPTTGTIVFNGEPLLLLARNRVRIGDKFTVALTGQEYELELVAIDRTTFTLRYHGEEITRPIKSGKSP
jgi:hypothetical protein